MHMETENRGREEYLVVSYLHLCQLDLLILIELERALHRMSIAKSSNKESEIEFMVLVKSISKEDVFLLLCDV